MQERLAQQCSTTPPLASIALHDATADVKQQKLRSFRHNHCGLSIISSKSMLWFTWYTSVILCLSQAPKKKKKGGKRGETTYLCHRDGDLDVPRQRVWSGSHGISSIHARWRQSQRMAERPALQCSTTGRRYHSQSRQELVMSRLLLGAHMCS